MVDINKSERGQALILIVLGIIGLLGFAALAIDGGRVYIDRRSMQNAADTGSLAGGLSYTQYFSANNIHYNSGWDCSSILSGAENQAESAAIARALTNGYIIDTIVDEGSGDFNGVRSSCTVEDFGGFVDKYIEMESFVTAVTPSSFAQFVFSGPLQQTVLSISRVHPQVTAGFGAAIVALNPAGCQGNQNGAQFDGNVAVFVNGGGIISNGCLGKNGSGDVVVSNGEISWGGDPSDYTKVGPGIVSPDPVQNSDEVPDYAVSIPEPECSSLPNLGLSNGGGSLVPGQYSNILVGANETAILAPGLYCISGDFRINGQATVIGDSGVTIFIENGDFGSNGDADIVLIAPAQDSNADPEIPGVLIYLAQGNTGEVTLLGTADSKYQGTVYAPDGTIEAGGSSSLLSVLNTQLIGWNVFIHGTTTIDILNDESINYQVPPNISLQR